MIRVCLRQLSAFTLALAAAAVVPSASAQESAKPVDADPLSAYPRSEAFAANVAWHKQVGKDEIRMSWFVEGQVGVAMVCTADLSAHNVTTSREVHNNASQTKSSRELSIPQATTLSKLAKSLPPSAKAPDLKRLVLVSVVQDGQAKTYLYDRRQPHVTRLYDLTGAYLDNEPDAPELKFRAFDGFNGKLGLNWQPIRHDPSHISLTKNPGKLTITTLQGTIFDDEKGRGEPQAKNIFVIDNPLAKDADFVVTTCLCGFKPTEAYQQAGLVLYDDDSNYLRWSLMFNYPKGSGVVFSFVRETDSDAGAVHVPAPQDAKTIWMRITKRGNSYEYATSTDGKNFTTHGAGPWGTFAPKKLGILAKNGGIGALVGIDACFDFFDMQSLPTMPGGKKEGS